MEYHSQAFFDSKGTLAGFVTMQRDVTERKIMEEVNARLFAEIEAQRCRLEAILEQLPVGVSVFDQNGISQLSNKQMKSLMPQKIPSCDLEGVKQWRATDNQGHTLPPEQWPGSRALRGESVIPGIELVHTDKSGNENWILVSAAPLQSKNGDVIGGISIAHDITESKRAEEALRASEAQEHTLAEELEKKNRLVTDFFINISHEFKTPLTVLMLGLELLETKAKKMKEGETFAGNLAAMKQNSYRLNRLVANLLDITKLDAGFMQPKWEEADLAGLLQNLAQSVQPYAMQKHLSLEYVCDAGEIPFTTDSSMLERIAVNLLSNAIKHTTVGGHITLTCRASSEGVSIAVADDGEGIPESKRAIIFDRFSQVDTRMTRASEGTGIGLALTRSLVELLGGSISVESAPGSGSTFSVELPYVKKEIANGMAEQGKMQMDKRIQMELSDIIVS